MVNHEMVQRAVTQFIDNEVYPAFDIEIISPPMNLFPFLQSRGTLSPHAAPDHAYKR